MKFRQLQHENDSWKRLLAFIMDENIYLKNRLSEVLKDKSNTDALEELEYFQNKFVREDELIRLLRNEVAELNRLLVREIFEDDSIIKELDKKLCELRNSLENLQKQFWKLKLEFDNYLSENI